MVLTVGTFLGGRIHVGLDNYQGGRAGDPPSESPRRAAAGACPARRAAEDGHAAAHRRPHASITRSWPRSPATSRCRCFRFSGAPVSTRNRSTVTLRSTNERTHEIIRAATDRSPMYTGVIEGVGPRYCPSVEDKVVRFADKSLAPDLRRARGARHPRGLPERDLDQPAVRCAVRVRAHASAASSARTSPAPATPSSTTSSIRAT